MHSGSVSKRSAARVANIHLKKRDLLKVQRRDCRLLAFAPRPPLRCRRDVDLAVRKPARGRGSWREAADLGGTGSVSTPMASKAFSGRQPGCRGALRRRCSSAAAAEPGPPPCMLHEGSPRKPRTSSNANFGTLADVMTFIARRYTAVGPVCCESPCVKRAQRVGPNRWRPGSELLWRRSTPESSGARRPSLATEVQGASTIRPSRLKS